MFGITREMLFNFLIRALVLFTAMPLHECAHGYVAVKLGDDTPRAQGRLTLNPFAHLDRIGSLMLFFTGFGWAKPVMVDARNFKRPRLGMALTALAGPVSNLIMSLVMLVVLKLLLIAEPGDGMLNMASMLAQIFYTIVMINTSLAVFNLLPVPPLDGSKIFGVLLPEKLYFAMNRYQQVISTVLILLLFFGFLSGPLMWLTGRVLFVLDALTFPIELLWRG